MIEVIGTVLVALISAAATIVVARGARPPTEEPPATRRARAEVTQTHGVAADGLSSELVRIIASQDMRLAAAQEQVGQLTEHSQVQDREISRLSRALGMWRTWYAHLVSEWAAARMLDTPPPPPADPPPED